MIGRAVGWFFARVIGVLLLPVAIWDDLQAAHTDDPWGTDE